MTYRPFLCLVLAATALSLASTAHAQSSATGYRWSVDVGLGWDNGISGNINSGGVGKINNQAVVILPNSYEKVYGTGFHLRFGGGYLIDDVTEVRAMFTYQSLTAELTTMGDIGTSKLYGQYDPYETFGLDAAFRRYADVAENVRAYGEGTLGLGFISETDVTLVAPTTNLAWRKRRRAVAGVAPGWRLRPSGAEVDVGDVRGRRPRGHRARDHQRQQLALDDAHCVRRADPVLAARPGRSGSFRMT